MDLDTMLNNCEKCLASYAPYQIGKDEGVGNYWCEISIPEKEPKGVCQFHNPNSRFCCKKVNAKETLDN
jgi:hypothetical protein